MPCVRLAAVVAYDPPLQPLPMPMFELPMFLSSLCIDLYSNIILFVHIAFELLGGAAFVIHGMNQGLYCCVFQLVLQDDCWIGAASLESNLFF